MDLAKLLDKLQRCMAPSKVAALGWAASRSQVVGWSDEGNLIPVVRFGQNYCSLERRKALGYDEAPGPFLVQMSYLLV